MFSRPRREEFHVKNANNVNNVKRASDVLEIDACRAGSRRSSGSSGCIS